MSPMRLALTKAFSGAKAVYLMIPPNPAHPNVREDQERVSDALVAAVQNAGVEYAVVLSSIGADKPEKTGPVVGLHNLEQKLNGVAALKAFYLRAGYFMENLLPQVGVIQSFWGDGRPVAQRPETGDDRHEGYWRGGGRGLAET